MTWSQTFAQYIEKRFGEGAQLKTAHALKIAPSSVSYWCRGSVPREKMRERIEKWSDGAVPAEPKPAKGRPSHPPRRTGTDG